MTGSLWGTLLPLVIGSAVVPMQVLITVLLLRSAAGRGTAVAWVAGMTAVRLSQGIAFGLILGSAAPATSSSSGEVVAILLLVMAIFFLVTGVRYIFKQEDPDAPPPKWLTMLEEMPPRRAFAFGFGAIAIAPKLWVFTLGAIAAIGAADLGRPAATVTFLVWIALAEIGHLLVLGIAFASPDRAAAVLDSIGSWLKSNNRLIMIVISLVFGLLFLWKALQGFGLV